MAYFIAAQESAIFFQEHMRMVMNLITALTPRISGAELMIIFNS
jgi:hypothetical protein